MHNTKSFKVKEFGCRHCGAVDKLSSELLAVLELVRLYFNKPVFVTSGYRCKIHNDNVGSTDKSQHRFGTAADIQIKGITPKEVYDYLDTTFPNSYGIGCYDTFCHIDVRKDKGRW